MGESFSTVVILKRRATTSQFFGGHHRHTPIISGGDSEVSRLNFFTYSLSSSSSYAFSPSASSFISFDMKIVLLGCG